ncbi:FecR family protein [Niastella sp. OAS944]|uniref:FecR family protein n=1 Tax=Niastella sp. OAS944 TaxID=2664089 RepID=UPI003470F920|nr:ferric-dicitrate binding protein FerR (iron transport regulator) [Chitinophagaceae bacterium OAS944]
MNEQQIEKISHIASLIVGDMQDSLTTDERQELNAWLQENGDNYLLYEELMDQEKLGTDLKELNKYDPSRAYERLTQKIFPEQTTGKRVYFKIWWYTAAALLLLVAGGIAYFALNKPAKSIIPQSSIIAQKKAPGTTPDTKKAVLILADGSSIPLNEIANGDIAYQGQVIIHKNQNGQLEYKPSGASVNIAGSNTLRTPRGGEYQVVLEDGTRIWLNSASTLQFPVQFNTNERRVILTGEAYFEVAKAIDPKTNNKKSFIVSVDNMEVQAIGTAFNISAYKEDNRSQTTVVEGLVKVSRHNKFSMLKPGKKLVAADTSFTIEDADVKQETAWKNGEFVFRNTSLKMVMNELARWYDMDVQYAPGVPSLHFSGEVQRESEVTKVLEMLEYTGGVKFTINNRIITVHPGKK